MSITDTARDFVDACDSGKGWAVCKQWCHDGASFSCQSDVFADTKTVEAYTEWAKNIMMPLPDGHYELKSLATDADRNIVISFAVFHGTHTGEGGPVPPTGKALAADYAYVMQFEGGKIRHMVKVWNDVQSLRMLGWA